MQGYSEYDRPMTSSDAGVPNVAVYSAIGLGVVGFWALVASFLF